MILEIQKITISPFDSEEFDKETLIVTTYPIQAWKVLERELKSKQASEIIVRYWYGDGRLRSAYIVSIEKWTAWLWDGESTPTILKGIQHYLAEVK